MIEMKIGYIEFNRTRVLLLVALLFLAVSIASKSPPEESKSEHNLNENHGVILEPFSTTNQIYIVWNATGITADDVEFRIYRFNIEASNSSDPDG